ncbi:MAG: hypothetical protein RR349_08245 [Oscillospiraceae bacterium]
MQIFDMGENEKVKQEIQHYIVFCALKTLLTQGEIDEFKYRKAAVALAENYGVLPYAI